MAGLPVGGTGKACAASASRLLGGTCVAESSGRPSSYSARVARTCPSTTGRLGNSASGPARKSRSAVVLQRHGRVLHEHEVPDGALEDVGEQGLRVVRECMAARSRCGCAPESTPASHGVVLVECHGTCQTAAPGSGTVGKPRRAGPDSVFDVVPLDEERQRQPDLAKDVDRDQAHPPAVEVRVDPAVQPGRSRGVPGPPSTGREPVAGVRGGPSTRGDSGRRSLPWACSTARW